MDFSGQTAIRLRAIGRRLGIFPPLVRAIRRLSGGNYEERFDAALLGAIQQGDTVWDVGANLGIYTAKFADRVGPTGRVLAFEPSPRSVESLRARFQENSRVTVYGVALSDLRGKSTFFVNESSDGTTDSLVERSPGAVAHEIEVHPGDDFLAAYPPNVVKVDVEGYELEVIRGLSAVLAGGCLRAVLIEVHFGILADRGLPDAPAQLCSVLRDCGMTVSWVDPSHLVGRRRDTR